MSVTDLLTGGWCYDFASWSGCCVGLRILGLSPTRKEQLIPHHSSPLILCILLSPKVLNMHGKVVTVRHQAVTQKKDNRFAVALDSDQNNIHVKDIVKVIDGPHSVSVSCCSLAESKRVGVGAALPIA